MQYIILLRGINVGGRKVNMAELKVCFQKANYSKVLTVLQTGNVILESDGKSKERLRQQVEVLLAKTFHYPAKVMVITRKQLEAALQNYPFDNHDPESHRYAVFTEKGFEKELMKQASELNKTIEDISEGKGVVYWRVLKGHTLDSAFGKFLARAATKHFLTNRNLNTLEKILAKCG